MLSLDEFFQTNILIEREKYRWLVESLSSLNIQIRNIADFGCNDGRETLTLMWLLGADEATGIDKDIEKIENAESTLGIIQNIIWAKGLPTNEVPEFLKTPQIKDAINFYQGDVTQRTQLQSEYYDLAFCNYVLYHIWLKEGKDRVQKAITEMVRTVRLGGVIAICEPIQNNRDSTFDIDFEPVFDTIGLKPLHVNKVLEETGKQAEYLYLREKSG